MPTSPSLPLPLADGTTVPVYHWTPPVAGYQNFGDELAPLIVAKLLSKRVGSFEVVPAQAGRPKLLTVGSVIQQARNGDVIWGSGVNGKSWPKNLDTHKKITVASVRGPLTKAVLDQAKITCPAVYGDPALLVPALFQREIAQEAACLSSDERGGIVYIPNLNDERLLSIPVVGLIPGVKRLSANTAPLQMVARIASAELVLSSSLHGIVLADALGVPVRLVASMFEPAFKYADYLMGTGRKLDTFAVSISDALRARDLPRAQIDLEALEASFPADLLLGFKTAMDMG